MTILLHFHRQLIPTKLIRIRTPTSKFMHAGRLPRLKDSRIHFLQLNITNSDSFSMIDVINQGFLFLVISYSLGSNQEVSCMYIYLN
jgi:hypothetical protein